MNSLLKLLTVISLFSFDVIAQEVTVNETDTKQITYGGGAGDAPICKISNDGTVLSKPGCYPVQPEPPCTEFVAMGQQNTSWASWKFKGTTLRITSLLSDISPLFNVDIDGKPTEVDGAQIGKDSLAFTCFTLFSVDNLDPNVEHTVNLTVKGASPNRNKTFEMDGRETVGPLSLINYTYTESSNTSSSSGNSSTAGSGSGSSESESGNGNGVQDLRVSASVSGVTVLLTVLSLYL
ncbi:hypothetical protein V5O48_017433 [Marasmius crinis-equi]|uniref:Uncharacterized protein n=1 Tax=Marasmius crinis-equi TaxID=585013 RepID=A0ABR3EP75_9AGAR